MQVGAAPGDYLTRHCQLVTSDLDQAREAVGRMWEHHESRLRRGRKYGIRWHQAGFAHSALSYVRSPSAIRVVCGPVSKSFHISLNESGRLHYRIGGQEVISTPGRAVAYAPGEMLELETEPFALLLMSLDGEAVRSALQQRSERAHLLASPVREFALDTPAGTAFRALCRWTARELDRPGAEIVTCEHAAASLERTLLMLFLDCFDEQQPLDHRPADDITQARVRWIEEWLDAQLTEPIGVEEMAAHAGVSVRSLQVAFRRYRGCSPMQRLMQLRLEAARKALGAAEPGVSVTQIAAEFGFFNFGRFAAYYRQTFGESPSETLARGRSPAVRRTGPKAQNGGPALTG